MAFVRLIVKARKIEKLKKVLEEEKKNSIQSSRGESVKHSAKQKYRHFWIGIRANIIAWITRKCSFRKHSCMYKTIYKLRRNGTFENFILKSIVGFISGFFLTYIFFMFFVFQLNLKLSTATIMCSVVGSILTIGLAFSYKVRCVVFLLLPQFFSKRGRQALMAYAFILAITGPAKNTLHNMGILSESMACGQEQLKAAVKQIIEVIKKPFYAIRDAIRAVVKTIKVIVKAIKEVLLTIKRVILAIVRVIKAAFQFLKKIFNICNKQLGTPFERCMNVFEDAITDCHAKLGPFFSWLCSITYLVQNVCYLVKFLDLICIIIEVINDSFIGVIIRKVKNFVRHIRSMFYVRIRFSHSFHFETTQSKSISDITAGIVTEIRQRTERLLAVFDFMSCVTSLVFLFIILRVLHYRYKFLTSERFDNRFITKNFREIDMRRAQMEKETVLPLNHRERLVYIAVTSMRLVKSERVKLSKAAVVLGTTTVKLSTHMMVDYALYWVLTVIRYHSRFQSKVQAPNVVGLHIEGSGFIAKLLKTIVKAFQPLGIELEIDTVPCLPDAIPPDYDRYVQIASLIVLCWILTIFEPYGLRLRHSVMCYYHPARARERAVWLYNHILRSRSSFLKFARRQLRRKVTGSKGITKITCKEYLRANLDSKFLRLCFGSDHQDACLLCGEVFRESDTVKPIHCSKPGCPGMYCEQCYADLQNICTVCMEPIQYGDLSDISEEKDSSENEKPAVKKNINKKKRRCTLSKCLKPKYSEHSDDEQNSDTEQQKLLTPSSSSYEYDSDYNTGSTTDNSYSYQQNKNLSTGEGITSRGDTQDIEKQSIPDYASLDDLKEASETDTKAETASSLSSISSIFNGKRNTKKASKSTTTNDSQESTGKKPPKLSKHRGAIKNKLKSGKKSYKPLSSTSELQTESSNNESDNTYTSITKTQERRPSKLSIRKPLQLDNHDNKPQTPRMNKGAYDATNKPPQSKKTDLNSADSSKNVGTQSDKILKERNKMPRKDSSKTKFDSGIQTYKRTLQDETTVTDFEKDGKKRTGNTDATKRMSKKLRAPSKKNKPKSRKSLKNESKLVDNTQSGSEKELKLSKTNLKIPQNQPTTKKGTSNHLTSNLARKGTASKSSPKRTSFSVPEKTEKTYFFEDLPLNKSGDIWGPDWSPSTFSHPWQRSKMAPAERAKEYLRSQMVDSNSDTETSFITTPKAHASYIDASSSIDSEIAPHVPPLELNLESSGTSITTPPTMENRFRENVKYEVINESPRSERDKSRVNRMEPKGVRQAENINASYEIYVPHYDKFLDYSDLIQIPTGQRIKSSHKDTMNSKLINELKHIQRQWRVQELHKGQSSRLPEPLGEGITNQNVYTTFISEPESTVLQKKSQGNMLNQKVRKYYKSINTQSAVKQPRTQKRGSKLMKFFKTMFRKEKLEHDSSSSSEIKLNDYGRRVPPLNIYEDKNSMSSFSTPETDSHRDDSTRTSTRSSDNLLMGSSGSHERGGADSKFQTLTPETSETSTNKTLITDNEAIPEDTGSDSELSNINIYFGTNSKGKTRIPRRNIRRPQQRSNKELQGFLNTEDSSKYPNSNQNFGKSEAENSAAAKRSEELTNPYLTQMNFQTNPSSASIRSRDSSARFSREPAERDQDPRTRCIKAVKRFAGNEHPVDTENMYEQPTSSEISPRYAENIRGINQCMAYLAKPEQYYHSDMLNEPYGANMQQMHRPPPCPDSRGRQRICFENQPDNCNENRRSNLNKINNYENAVHCSNETPRNSPSNQNMNMNDIRESLPHYCSNPPHDLMDNPPIDQYAPECCHCNTFVTPNPEQPLPRNTLDDDGCSECSFRSGFPELPYQNTDEFFELVNELGDTLCQRNRERVQRTMREFEMLSRQNKNLEKPIFDDDSENECTTYRHPRPLCRCRSKQTRRDKSGGSPFSKLDCRSVNVPRDPPFGQSFAQSGYVEQVAKHIEPKHEDNIQKYPKPSQRFGNKQWQMNPRTGEWYKVCSDYPYEQKYYSQAPSTAQSRQPCVCERSSRGYSPRNSTERRQRSYLTPPSTCRCANCTRETRF